MAKYLINQNSFQFGEVSPELQGRRDLEEYKNSVEILENFIVQPTGGVIKRPGFRHVKQFSSLLTPTLPRLQRPRLIPFVFSKEEKYMVMLPSDGSKSDIKIFDQNGAEVSIAVNKAIFPSASDAKKWQFAQTGDVLVLTYNDPDSEDWQRVPPMFVVRDRFETFNIFSLSHPSYNDGILDKGNFNHAIYRPYLNPNSDPLKRLWFSTTTVGTGRTMTCQDSSGNYVPLFTPYHAFLSSGSSPSQIGGYFKVTKAGTTGVVYVTGISQSSANIPPADINTGTDVVTHASHNYQTGDMVTLLSLNTAVVVTGYDIENKQFFVRRTGANTYTLHPTYESAVANTNVLDFTNSGDGLRVDPYKVSSCSVTIEVAAEATLTAYAAGTDDWQESAWSAWQGFPRTITFFQGRSIWGGNRFNPDTIWFSQNGNIYNLMKEKLAQDSSAPTAASATNSNRKFVIYGSAVKGDPNFFTIASNEANNITWLASKGVILAGTDGAEYSISGGETGISSLDTPQVKKQTSNSSTSVQPVEYGESLFHVTRDGRRVMDFKYNDTNGSFVANNLNFLAKHIVFRQRSVTSSTTYKGATLTELYFQPGRSRFWALTSNNELVGCTYVRELGSTAWDYHPLHTSFTAISSICVLPGDDENIDNLFLLVERGASFWLLRMGDDFEHPYLVNTSSDVDDVPIYCDGGGYTTLGSTTNTVTGLSYLNGQTVQVLVNGVQETNKTVSAGSITLDATYNSGTKVVYGLQYTSKLQTLDIEGGGFFGTSDSTRQRQDRIALRLNKSQGGKYANHLGTLIPIEYKDPNGTTNNEVFTGIKRLDFEITPDMENKILIQHDVPLPFNLLSITHRGVSYE